MPETSPLESPDLSPSAQATSRPILHLTFAKPEGVSHVQRRRHVPRISAAHHRDRDPGGPARTARLAHLDGRGQRRPARSLVFGGLAAASFVGGNYIGGVQDSAAALYGLHLQLGGGLLGTMINGLLGNLAGGLVTPSTPVTPIGPAVPATPTINHLIGGGGLLKRLRQGLLGGAIVAGSVAIGSATSTPSPSPAPPPAPAPNPPAPGPTPPPAPPMPIPPADPLAVKLKALYPADSGTSAEKALAAHDLSQLYLLAAGYAGDSAVTTSGALVDRIRSTAATLVKAGVLTAIRAAIAGEVAALFPADVPLTDSSRTAAATLFKRISTALGGLA